MGGSPAPDLRRPPAVATTRCRQSRARCLRRRARAASTTRGVAQVSDLAGYEDIKARHTGGNGYDPGHRAIELVRFADMKARLCDAYLIKHLLSSTGMAVVYGDPGAGKTYLAVHIGLSLAAGSEFFGRRVRKVGVIYIAAEAGRGIENRIIAARHEFKLPATTPFAAITSPVDLCADNPDLENLIAIVQSVDVGMPIGLIIIDTLSRVMAGGNENSPED